MRSICCKQWPTRRARVRAPVKYNGLQSARGVSTRVRYRYVRGRGNKGKKRERVARCASARAVKVWAEKIPQLRTEMRNWFQSSRHARMPKPVCVYAWQSARKILGRRESRALTRDARDVCRMCICRWVCVLVCRWCWFNYERCELRFARGRELRLSRVIDLKGLFLTRPAILKAPSWIAASRMLRDR